MQAAFSGTAGTRKSFAKTKDRSPAPEWDRGNLKEWRKTLSKERRDSDLQKLSRIFNLAAKVPELRDALEWANGHGIDFIVDHRARAGGYYTMGTGVVAIVDSSFRDDSYAASVLVHEIRHAWQDYYGMIPTTGKSFTGYYIRLAAIEADATAHESLAFRQAMWARSQDYWENHPDGSEKTSVLEARRRANQERHTDTVRLWADFTYWYDSRARGYGETAIKQFGHKLGIPGVVAPELDAEYEAYKGREAPQIEGLDVFREEELRRLGKGFKGGNYFNEASHDVIARQFLSPGAASKLFRSGSHVPKNEARKRLINEIRRRELLLKRHRGKAVLL